MEKLKRFQVSLCEMDYLKVISKVDFIEIENEQFLNKVRSILIDEVGLDELLVKDGFLYRKKELGIKFYYGKNPLNRSLYLEMELSGHYFIIKDYYKKLDGLIERTFNKLGLIPKINRIDLRKDIMSKNKALRNCFRVFPKFFKKNDSVMMMKGKKTTRHLKAKFSQYFNNQQNLSVPTGFKVSTSRFVLTGYERLINLEEKLIKGKVTQAYYDYYMEVYKSFKSVSRIELTLKQESCALANLLFFKKGNKYKKNKRKFFNKLLSHWANGHTIYDVDQETGKKGKVNEVFSELFSLKDYTTIKETKEEIGVSAGIGLLSTSKVKKRDSEYYLRQLAKALVCEGKSKESLEYILNDLKTKMSTVHIGKKDELSNYEKTLQFLGTSEEELQCVRSEILENKVIGIQLIRDVEKKRRDLNSSYDEYEQALLYS